MLIDGDAPVCFPQPQGLLVESVGGAQRARMHTCIYSCECACVYMSALISPHETRYRKDKSEKFLYEKK